MAEHSPPWWLRLGVALLAVVPGVLVLVFSGQAVILTFDHDRQGENVGTISLLRVEVAVLLVVVCAIFTLWRLGRIFNGDMRRWWLAPIAFLLSLLLAAIAFVVLLGTFASD